MRTHNQPWAGRWELLLGPQQHPQDQHGWCVCVGGRVSAEEAHSQVQAGRRRPLTSKLRRMLGHTAWARAGRPHGAAAPCSRTARQPQSQHLQESMETLAQPSPFPKVGQAREPFSTPPTVQWVHLT